MAVVRRVNRRPALGLCRFARVGVDCYSVFQSSDTLAGWEVDRLHVHVVPRYEDDSINIGGDHEPLSADRGKDVASALGAVLD